MTLRLLPREEIFFDLFNQAADNVLQAARGLKDLLDNFHDIERRAEAIKALEDRGDEITHEIIDRLNRTFVTPRDREDIFGLAKQLDDVIDCLEASSARIVVYRVPTRPKLEPYQGFSAETAADTAIESGQPARSLPLLPGPS